MYVCSSGAFVLGSSPLARGLLLLHRGGSEVIRIIPARAGFTTGLGKPAESPWDHPRSRGVYDWWSIVDGLTERIIPARAGFTTGSRSSCATGSDHPRSRGVYAYHRPYLVPFSGSSPLARGLRGKASQSNFASRIIPARAGFTQVRTAAIRRVADHPRSRGVYTSTHSSNSTRGGSSPLARGLLLNDRIKREYWRIIPARAGFTLEPGGFLSQYWDHPRSRGVYLRLRIGVGLRRGSSPLARGLRWWSIVDGLTERIIPARAGFTCMCVRVARLCWDHPRSRGVYPRPRTTDSCIVGSSPLARGLLCRQVASQEVPGIIPARAGFTCLCVWG